MRILSMRLRLPWGRYSALGISPKVSPNERVVNRITLVSRVTVFRRQRSENLMRLEDKKEPTLLSLSLLGSCRFFRL